MTPFILKFNIQSDKNNEISSWRWNNQKYKKMIEGQSNSNNDDDDDDDDNKMNHIAKKRKIIRRKSDFYDDNDDKYPHSLVYGVLFSNKFKYEIINIIYNNYYYPPSTSSSSSSSLINKSKYFNQLTIYNDLLLILKKSDKYYVYKNYKKNKQQNLIQFSTLKLFQHFVKKNILNYYNNQHNKFIIGEKFNLYRTRLIQRISLINIKQKEIIKQSQKIHPSTPSASPSYSDYVKL